MDELTVSAHFVRAALSGAQKQGWDIQALLREAGIAPDLLATQARVTGSQYTRLMQVVWSSLEDEFMGFASVRSKPGTFATMCQLAIHCHTLESVLRRSEAFYKLFEKPVNIALRHEGNQTLLEIVSESPIDDPYHFLQESLLVIWHRFASWLIGQHILLDEAFFDYPRPAHADEYRHLFYAPLRFDQKRTGLRFPSRFLSMPVIRDLVEMKRFLETSPANLLAKPDDSNSYTAKIRQLLGRDFSTPLLDFEQIATQLNASPQTLRRRLKQENTSFQEIKDHLRRDLAIYHLSRHDYSINEIAYRVGFTEPSTFHRAFKKWTGATPGAYRDSERDNEREQR